MSVNVPNSGNYQQKLGSHCTDLRDALQEILNDASYITSMGGAAFLTAAVPDGLGLTSTDANVIMSTIGAVTATNATVKALQAWLASTEPLWGGN